MTLNELNEEFDNKCADLMAEYMQGRIEYEKYDTEMFYLGKWYDEEKEKIDESISNAGCA